jgi:hypothetical protein
MQSYENNSAPINYIKLINAVWQHMPFVEGYKGQHAVLFLALVDSINRNKWKGVSLPLDYILNKIGFCRKVYTDSRNWLVLNKIIEVAPGKNANQMALFNIGLAVHIWTATDTTTDTGTDTPTPDLPVQKRTSRDTHYKTVNSIKPKTLNIEFNVWFELYGNKSGEKTCKALWTKLTDDERKQAIEHTPKYLEATDIIYRQNPKRYLDEKTFTAPVVNRKHKNNNHSQKLLPKAYGTGERF